MQNVQFRRGTKAQYDALLDKDENDLYIIGGNTEPVSMYIGDEMIQDVINDPIVVTSEFGSYDTGTTIEAGTTVAEILTKMLCKEMFPTFTAPTASISYSNAPSGNKFVGDSVTIPTLTLSMIPGSFNSEWNQSSPIYNTSDVKITTSSLVGFEGYVTGTTMSNSISSQSATVAPGTNSLTINGSYDYESPSNNPVSNLNNPCPDIKWLADTATATTKTISCTGVYRIYSNAAVENPSKNGEQGVTTSNKSTVESLTGKYANSTTNSTFVLKLGFSSMTAGVDSTYREIHLPENVKIESQYGYGLAGYDLDASFNCVGQVTHGDITYNKFVFGNENIGANTFQISCKVYSSNQYI